MLSDNPTRPLVDTLSVVASTVILFGLPINALASSCAPGFFTLSEAYEAADSIIVGLVTECGEEISSEPWANGGGSDCSFDSLEVLKESKPARDYGGVASSVGCGLSLKVGNQYLLFLDSENRPMWFSAGLNGAEYPAQLSGNYQRILREFRDGIVDELSEPWILADYENTCYLSHRVGGHSVAFSSPKPDTEQSFQNWTRETVDGKTTYVHSAFPKAVAVSNLPDFPIGKLALSISFREKPPAPVRQATVSVASRSWSLYRTEITFSHRGTPTLTQVHYQVGGQVSEQILSAMSNPSDVLVSAVLINSPNADSDSQPETSQLDQGSVQRGLEAVAKSSVTPSARRVRAKESRREPPTERVLRLETRSTQLPAAVESFRACYEGVEG